MIISLNNIYFLLKNLCVCGENLNTSYTIYSFIENRILNQVSSIEDGIAYKTEDHIKRSYQASKKMKEDIKVLLLSLNHKLYKLNHKIYYLILLLK